MPDAAAYAVESLALVFWSFQLAPQCYQNWRRKDTTGLSSLMMLSWSLGSLCTAITSIGGGLRPLFVVQPNVFMVFSLGCWIQCSYYPDKRLASALWRGVACIALFAAIAAGGELLRDVDDDAWPFQLVNACSVFFFVAGFIPQYAEFYKLGCVTGVSFLFLSIDMIGAVLSVVALALQPPFNGLAAGSYIAVFVLDGCIMLLSLLWRSEVVQTGAVTEPLNDHTDVVAT